MIVVVDRPPNFAAIQAAFPQAAQPGVLFAYGDTIFNPSGDYIPPQLLAHEEVHQRQHVLIGGPVAWWDLYIANPAFRYSQELHAHIVEYHDFVKRIKNRGMQRDYLNSVATRLSGPLYFPDAIDAAKRFLEARHAIATGKI